MPKKTIFKREQRSAALLHFCFRRSIDLSQIDEITVFVVNILLYGLFTLIKYFNVVGDRSLRFGSVLRQNCYFGKIRYFGRIATSVNLTEPNLRPYINRINHIFLWKWKRWSKILEVNWIFSRFFSQNSHFCLLWRVFDRYYDWIKGRCKCRPQKFPIYY